MCFRGDFAPAETYGNLADKPYTTLVEAFRSMQIEGHLENGDIDHEVGAFCSSEGEITSQL